MKSAALRGAIMLLAAAGHALAQKPSEYPVKAAYLLNFARYTEWPARPVMAPDRELTLCIVGSDPFGASLAPIERQSVRGRELRVRRGVGHEALGECEILFVPEAEERRLASILRAASGRPILTVSDIEGFVESGGMIGLVLAGQRTLFDVNFNAVRSSGLRLSAQVLRLARNVLGAKAIP